MTIIPIQWGWGATATAGIVPLAWAVYGWQTSAAQSRGPLYI